MNEVEQRAALAAAIAASEESLAALSRMLGRNVAWLQQYFTRGTPRLLPEEARRRLASYLGVADEALGGPPAPALIRRLDVAASAGPGRLSDRDAPTGEEPIAADTLRRLGVKADNLRWLRVEGDSMVPLLNHGDRILVDHARRLPASRDDGLWVVRIDGAVLVKHLHRAGRVMRVISANEAYPDVEHPADGLEVLGRVVRMMRDF